MNLRLALALDYLDHGFNPLPIISGEIRHTPFKWKPYQNRWVTRDEVIRWWGAHPEWNIALVCGEFSGLVAIDADDAEAVRYCQVHLDSTPLRSISSRGMHFAYRHPGTGIYVATNTKIHPTLPIDVKGEGGLITGIGSVHSSGFTYVLDEGGHLVPPKSLPIYRPEWFPPLKRLEAPKPVIAFRGSLDGLQRAERYLAACEGAGSGCRNSNTFRVAAAVVRDFNLPIEKGRELMAAWNELRNDPPLAEAELRDIVDSCLRSGQNPIGFRLNESSPKRGRR